MEVGYTDEAKKDIIFWKNSGQTKIMNKISALITSIQTTPFEGLGKPEPLKYQFAGLWSRRINQEHRLVYEVTEKIILIHSLKGHYK